jgi:tetratricopeptide (TPR) repeat protein
MKKTSLKTVSGVMLSVLFTLTPLVLTAHDGDKHGEDEAQATSRVLGNISFPTTTGSEQAQKAFIEGMLLLHLFEYPFAQERFQRAQELDPGFVMAYWGEAMTYNHPIWDEQNQEAAQATMNRLGDSAEARQSSTSSQKEKDYLAALDILYGDDSKADRDRAYMRHMQQMASNYPDDHEVQLFYALSIFGASAGVRDVPAYMRSTAISQGVFYANREHPGAAHYLIHGVDDPVHAPLGLEAARALAVMAPDAGHSQHMTSHIFTAVGMWDDVISANESAVLVSNKMRLSRDQPPRHWGHYNFWLLYGLLQQGRHNEAAQLLKAAYEEDLDPGAVPKNPLVLDADDSQIGSLVQMWGRYMIETRGKDRDKAAWTFNMGEAFDPQLTYHYVLALDAAHFEKPTVAKNHLDTFQTLKAKLQTAILAMERQAPTDLVYLDRLNVLDLEIQAAIASAEENTDKALEFAREASRLEGEMPFAFGPPFIDLPSAELLGEILLDAGHFDEAVEAFETQGERTRLKSLPMLGLARAEQARGNKTAAIHIRETLGSIWTKADADIKTNLNDTRSSYPRSH